MNKIVTAALAATLLVPTLAFAQDAGRGALPPKHDSNTLHKLGNAIQYPVRKAGENTSKTARKAAKATQYPVNKAAQNTSITAHRAAGQNSVVKRRTHTGRKAKRVIKPNGTVGHIAPK